MATLYGQTLMISEVLKYDTGMQLSDLVMRSKNKSHNYLYMNISMSMVYVQFIQFEIKKKWTATIVY